MPRGQLKAVANAVCCTDSAWQRGLKEDDKAQHPKEVPRSPKNCWAWPVRVRWVQSPATPQPVQNCVRCATVPLSSALVSVSGTWLTGHGLATAGESSRDPLQGCAPLWTGFVAQVLYSRAEMGQGLSLPWDGRVQPGQLSQGYTHTAPASPMGVDMCQQINVVLSSASQDKQIATYLVCSFWRGLDLHKVFLMISVLLIHGLEEMFSELPWESNTLILTLRNTCLLLLISKI